MGVRFKRLIDTLPGLVWTARADGWAELMNQRWCRYTGLRLDAALGTGWHNAIHPEDLSRVLERWRSFVEQAVPAEIQLRLRRHDGAYRRFLLHAAPLADPSGRMMRWCGINTEIEALLQKQEAIHEQERASITHEINQPLCGIVTNATVCLRMLSATPPNIDGARAIAERMLRDGNRATEVIHRLRALFAHEVTGTEPVRLNEVAQEVLAFTESELTSNDISVGTEFADDLPDISADCVQLQQVILNLIVNAVDALRSVRAGARHLHIGTGRGDHDEVRLWVRDCGVGVDPGNTERLFDAFYTTKRNGMGLGLSISRSIIERYGGRLWASANAGPGSTFSLSLPVPAARVLSASNDS